ncbi:hypothetical protein Psta_2329 [Pirellula staleyi DSM 6068]|uniref:Uncharacterized protein n=1 Tax=Pirellula staleyi (strain ATCC 27377 / DSM 6068 / ICPB 4128) TaxID=530564 RepID=D2R3P5_PIRSD|nr:hypothetical protein [Pirellula staleyi]ADB16999.1 hypothetical protein Psta_2329 [Pirellula staleyi DSM 6068]
MSTSREHLLGYLLGALERTEIEQVEQQLAADPRLAEELMRLRDKLDIVGLCDAPLYHEPPADLASRTLDFVLATPVEEVSPLVSVAQARLATAVDFQDQPHLSEISPASYSSRTWYSLSDVLMGISVSVAALVLFFPAIAHSRFQSELAVCQNHLRQLGFALQEYSDHDPDHRFPQISQTGNRSSPGIYGPMLVSSELVSDPRLLLCPSSKLANDVSSFAIPTLDEIDRADKSSLQKLRERMGGSFGYAMGHLMNGSLFAPANARRTNYALLGDAPCDSQPGRRSSNHGGRGQNVLYEDGHIAFISCHDCDSLPDDPFHNHQGAVAAGTDPNDSVLGHGFDSPIPITLVGQ